MLDARTPTSRIGSAASWKKSESSWNGLPSDLSVECVDLADFLIIAEAITGIAAEALMHLPRLHTAEHALSAPNTGIGETSYHNTFADKAAAMTHQIIKGHPLVDGNKRAGCVCLLEFVRRNGREWAAPPDASRCRKMFACLCCHYLTMSEEPPGSYRICPVCFWEDDVVQVSDPESAGGANSSSLVKARRNFAAFGASEQRFLSLVRKPRTDEIPTISSASIDGDAYCDPCDD